MARTPSPLRYPGGKTSIWEMISKIIKDNGLLESHYVEPYAGGCGLALTLLFKGYVHELHLNDIDRSIYCFWKAILKHTNQFVKKIETTEVTVDEWYRQREIQQNKGLADEMDLAFSTFFLNRTNRSGVILKAGMIGGQKQDGAYKLDCRFNKNGLIEKIRRIEKYKEKIHFSNLDAIDFIKTTSLNLPKKNTLYCVDPPYYDKGSTLYTNFYEHDDHLEVAKLLKKLKMPWVLTYDNADEIRQMYDGKQQYYFDLNYSAAEKRIGTELLIASNLLKIETYKSL